MMKAAMLAGVLVAMTLSLSGTANARGPGEIGCVDGYPAPPFTNSCPSPARKVAINQAMIGIGSAPASRGGARDFARAQREILTLSYAQELNEAALMAFAKEHKYEETVAALSVMTGVSLTIIDHLIRGDRHDPILIMGKSLSLQWATVRALILVRIGPGRPNPSIPEMEEARLNYERLVPATAQRVLKFWQKRPGDSAA